MPDPFLSQLPPLVLLKDFNCILAAPRFSVAEEARANFCFGSKNVCGQVGKSLCFWHV